MGSAEVIILGQKYTIKGEASEESIHELARTVEAKINEVKAHLPNISTQQTLVLALFNMAEEAGKLKAEKDTVSRHITDRAATLAGLFD